MEIETELKKTSLFELYKDETEDWTEYCGWQLPASFNGVLSELQEFREGCVLLDKSYLGVIKVTGGTAQDFLHRMSTNPINDLQLGYGMETVIPTAEGRFVDWIVVYRLNEEGLFLVTSPGAEDRIIDHLQGYIFFKDDVQFEKVGERWGVLELSGPETAKVAEDTFEVTINSGQKYHLHEVEIPDGKIYLTPLHDVREGDLQVMCPADYLQTAYEKLMSAETEVVPVGFEAFEIMRIDAGKPAYPSEINDQYMLTEAHLDSALNLEKGCFTGQEVIARTLNYDKIKQRLCHLHIESGNDISTPAPLFQDGRSVGELTSLIYHPEQETYLGLGYIKSRYIENDAIFQTENEKKVYLINKTKPR